MFRWPDRVRVTVEWLDLEPDAEGTVRRLLYLNPVSYLVEFAAGTYVVPAIHLEHVSLRRVRGRLAFRRITRPQPSFGRTAYVS